MKRLGVFLFFDQDGIVDDYVPYFLEKLRQHCSELVVVVNGAVNDVGAAKLKKNCDSVVMRENSGFDSAAYKHVLENYGYDALQENDELLLCNYTCFGPIFPFEELFAKMQSKECDFWGINRNPAIDALIANTKIIEHIQSYFMVFRKTILESDHFRKYWESLKTANNYLEAIANHELRCSDYFEKLGFYSSCYIDYKKYAAKDNASIFYAYQQLEEDRSPFLKRKVLYISDSRPIWLLKDGHHNYDVIQFIRKNSEYDTSLIYRNIIRTQKIEKRSIINEIKRALAYYKYSILSIILPWTRKRNLKKRISHHYLLTNEKLVELFDYGS